MTGCNLDENGQVVIGIGRFDQDQDGDGGAEKGNHFTGQFPQVGWLTGRLVGRLVGELVRNNAHWGKSSRDANL